MRSVAFNVNILYQKETDWVGHRMLSFSVVLNIRQSISAGVNNNHAHLIDVKLNYHYAVLTLCDIC